MTKTRTFTFNPRLNLNVVEEIREASKQSSLASQVLAMGDLLDKHKLADDEERVAFDYFFFLTEGEWET